ncbi:MAG: indole-3-glycerol phosphate synthase TrpC [Rhodospirillaceae bacterium]|nr:indole-3-glycerol phosphate synthase TrpC [Rhodospirillaceae bacterium]
MAAVRESAGESFLGRMASSSRERVREARTRESEGALLARTLALPAPPPLRLGSFGMIAELKYRSPAAGTLTAQDFDGDAQVRAYGAGGAAAVSVLTEPEEFRGSLDDLRQAAGPLNEYRIPAMRKDFLTDPYQVLEARAAGAGGVLVIVTMLGDVEVAELLACAAQCGLFVLLEGFDEADLERIGGIDAPPDGTAPLLCGVNCRDLRDLAVNRDRFRLLAPYLPPHLPAVAESGIEGAQDIAAVASLGYRAALVGSALMQAADASRELAAMTAAGAQAVRSKPCS